MQLAGDPSQEMCNDEVEVIEDALSSLPVVDTILARGPLHTK